MGQVMIERVLIDNINRFVSPLSDKELGSLSEFLMYDYRNKPNKLQERFIDEFFEIDRFNAWVEAVGKKLHFQKAIEFEVNKVRIYLQYYVLRRFVKLVNKEKREENKFKSLKSDIKSAVAESYYDNVFDKCEGWCNVADVLIKYNLLKPETCDEF